MLFHGYIFNLIIYHGYPNLLWKSVLLKKAKAPYNMIYPLLATSQPLTPSGNLAWNQYFLWYISALWFVRHARQPYQPLSSSLLSTKNSQSITYLTWTLWLVILWSPVLGVGSHVDVKAPGFPTNFYLMLCLPVVGFTRLLFMRLGDFLNKVNTS